MICLDFIQPLNWCICISFC